MGRHAAHGRGIETFLQAVFQECFRRVEDVITDASLLLQSAEANGTSACMQLYRRADGTVITDDCPVGLRRIRDSWKKVKSAVATFALFFVAQSSFAQNKPAPTAEDLATRGKVAFPPKNISTGGMVAPGVPLGGAPAPMNWRTAAMNNASIKKMADKIAEKEKDAPQTDSAKLEILKMRYSMAEEANKQNLPYFALQEIDEIKSSLEVMQSNAASNNLLKLVLNAKMSTSKKLGVKDTKCIQDEIDKLR